MNSNGNIILTALLGVTFGIVLLVGLLLLPWHTVGWGTVSLAPARTVTVTGTAKTQLTNQVSSFTAGINVTDDNKDSAISKANSTMEAIIAAVKEFGIPDGDIKTNNLSIFQQEDMYYDNGIQKYRPGSWRVSNNVDVTLRDVTKATGLTEVLTSSGATNVYGPNFSVDDTDETEIGLSAQALENARIKAAEIANASGRKLGGVISVTESGADSQSPVYMREMGGGGGAPLEPGGSTVQKSLSVTFELR